MIHMIGLLSCSSCSWRRAVMVPITMIQPSEIGISAFQPSFMNWS